MWVTPNNAIDGWAERMQWSDGSIVDYGNWFTGEPNSGGNEDEVEMRMSCDGWACFHGRWNDVDGDTASVRNPKPPALSSLAWLTLLKPVGCDVVAGWLPSPLPLRDPRPQVHAGRPAHDLPRRAEVLP